MQELFCLFSGRLNVYSRIYASVNNTVCFFYTYRYAFNSHKNHPKQIYYAFVLNLYKITVPLF